MAKFKHFWESWKNNEDTNTSSVKDDNPVPEINSLFRRNFKVEYIQCQLETLHILMENGNMKMRVSS